MAEEKVSVKVDKEIDSLLGRLAMQLKTSKADIISRLFQMAIEEKPKGKLKEKYTELAESLKEVASVPTVARDPFDRVLQVMLLREFKGEKTSDVDLNKILAISAIKTLTQMDPATLIALQRVGTEGTSSQFWQNYMQQQAQMQQNLKTMLFGQRLQQTEQQYQTLADAINERMELINSQIANLEKQIREKPAKDMKSELDEWVAKRKILEDFAETIKPEKIVTEKGKINWGKFLDRALKIGEKIVTRVPATAPPMKPIEKMPVPSIPEKKPEVPKEEVKEEVSEEKPSGLVQVSVQEETPKSVEAKKK